MASDVQIRPVFIVGCDRSGTTMLASQLGRGSNVVVLPEMQFIADILGRYDLGSLASMKSAHRRLINNFRFRMIGIPFTLHEFIASAKEGRAEIIRAIIRNYIFHKNIDTEKENLVWVEHSPLQRNYFDLLIKYFPESKFIHIVRDPRAVYISMKGRHRFNIWEPLSFVRYWIFAVGISHLNALSNPERCIEVRYEDILCDNEVALKEICDFIEIDFVREMLLGGGLILPTFTKRQHALTQLPARPDKAYEWKGRISKEERMIIEYYCSAWLKHYGYKKDIKMLNEPSLRVKIRLTVRAAVMTIYTKLYVRLHNQWHTH